MFLSAMLSRLFVAELWPPAGKRPNLLALFVLFSCVFVTFPCGVLGQVWYLVVLIPDICLLPYFAFASFFSPLRVFFSCVFFCRGCLFCYLAQEKKMIIWRHVSIIVVFHLVVYDLSFLHLHVAQTSRVYSYNKISNLSNSEIKY